MRPRWWVRLSEDRSVTRADALATSRLAVIAWGIAAVGFLIAGYDVTVPIVSWNVWLAADLVFRVER